MQSADIKKINFSKLKNEKLKQFYNILKNQTNDFDSDYLELADKEISVYLQKVKEFEPEAFEDKPKTPKTPRKKTEKKIDFESDDVVEDVMNQYNLSQDKAIELIKLRKEAFELKKEGLEQLISRLNETDFYAGKLSNTPIDKGRERNLEKDSKQTAITEADELRMTGRKFKRISKAGAKNQYGTSKGGNVYYEYRQNRRDVDDKIKLEQGGRLDLTTSEIESLKNQLLIKGLRLQLITIDDFNNAFIQQIAEDEATEINDYMKEAQELGSSDFNVFFRSFILRAKGIDIWKPKMKHGGHIFNSDDMVHLKYEIAVYVPSTKNVDENISESELKERIEEVESYLAETFGGFTSSEKIGGYFSSKNTVVKEKIIPVTAFATEESFNVNKTKLVNKLSLWAKKWGQEAVGLEFEGDLYYVPQKFKKGGKLVATYIPRYDIKSLTTVYGKTIKGKDLIDGAYTTRKDIVKPKMSRTQFEEETFEFAKGGGVGETELPYCIYVTNTISKNSEIVAKVKAEGDALLITSELNKSLSKDTPLFYTMKKK